MSLQQKSVLWQEFLNSLTYFWTAWKRKEKKKNFFLKNMVCKNITDKQDRGTVWISQRGTLVWTNMTNAKLSMTLLLLWWWFLSKAAAIKRKRKKVRECIHLKKNVPSVLLQAVFESLESADIRRWTKNSNQNIIVKLSFLKIW